MSNSSIWLEWLNNVEGEQQLALYEALSSKLDLATSSTNNEKKVRIVKTPIEDLFVTNPPPYVDIFRLISAYEKFNFSTNLLVKGPKGDGKSLSITTFAHKTKTPLIVQECSEDVKKMDLMGAPNFLGGETIFTLGCIPAAIETANEYGRCILCFEEVNALTNQVQKMLNAITDFRKQCSMPFLGKTYKLKEGAYLWVVGLMNPSAYSGTYDLNEDLKSRFEEIDLTYPDVGMEKAVLQTACADIINTKMAKPVTTVTASGPTLIEHLNDDVLSMLVKLAKETRQQATSYALSTRDLVRLAQNFVIFGPEAALQFVLCKFEGDEDKNTMSKRISSIFAGVGSLDKHWKGI